MTRMSVCDVCTVRSKAAKSLANQNSMCLIREYKCIKIVKVRLIKVTYAIVAIVGMQKIRYILKYRSTLK